MRKFISISLAIVLVLSAIFCVNASAARSTDFLEKFKADRTLTVKLDDSNFENGFIKVSGVNASAKAIKKDNGSYGFKISGGAKVGPFNAKLRGNEDNLNAYVFIFKVNLKNLGVEIDLSDVTEGVGEVMEVIDSGALDYIKYINDTEEEIEKYGKVTVENLGPNYEKIIQDLPADLQAQFADKTDEEIAALLDDYADSENPELRYLAAFANAQAKFYYKNGNFIGFSIKIPDGEGGEVEIDTTEKVPLIITSITADADAKAFDEPKFAIDITNFIKAIIGRFM